MLRFLVCFVILLVTGYGLLLAPFTQPAVVSATSTLVKVSAGCIRLFGGHARGQGDFLTNPANGYTIEVRDTCNASNVTLLLWAAILSFPAPWRLKGKGLAAGTVAIHLINLLRIISLFYLGQYNSTWFDFAHSYVWESVIMVATLVIFSLWVQRVRLAQSGAGLPAGQSA